MGLASSRTERPHGLPPAIHEPSTADPPFCSGMRRVNLHLRAVGSGAPCVQTKLILGLGVAAFLAAATASAHAQQPDATLFGSAYQTATTKAAEACRKLWANPAFDPLRDKVPLGSQKPTMQMLTSSARLDPKDRPMADLAIKVVEQCRAAYTPAYAMLQEATRTLIEGLYREEDAWIAQLYVGKITFGEFNVAEDRLTGEIFRAFSGSQQTDDGNPPVPLPRDVRIALVIGNGKYANLPKLSNPTNDAEAMADVLAKMGYATRLLLNASEQDLRKEVRKFAGESGKADVALLFYAGHGAQLNGENYLLPADIDIPQTDADIQLSGLKIDDLINSIRSNTKIVFLDACRDNPALFKNLAKGRGGRAVGLAPATGSNLDPGKPGGGIFIAYATDSGSIAADGSGKHSPFTQALLRYLQQPMSVDDLFSLVTKEVRLVTNNAQRPYKYASLEAIICLTGPCSVSQRGAVGPASIVQEAKHSEAEELQIAVRSNSIDALKTFLEKYPETSKRPELIAAISRMRRAEFTEWTLYELASQRFPQFIKLASIQPIGDRVAVETRYLADPSAPGQKFPEGTYGETLFVADCKHPLMAAAESKMVDPAGKVLYAYKWADPKFLDLSIGPRITPGSISATTQKIACDERLRTPLLAKKAVAKMMFTSLSSTAAGDGEMFYVPIDKESSAGEREVIVISKFHNARGISLAGHEVPDVSPYVTEASRVRLDCRGSSMSAMKSEYYDSSNNLAYMYSYPTDINAVQPASPLALLRRIVCDANEAQK
jgi:uncharacterized caspase-like protein